MTTNTGFQTGKDSGISKQRIRMYR